MVNHEMEGLIETKFGLKPLQTVLGWAVAIGTAIGFIAGVIVGVVLL